MVADRLTDGVRIGQLLASEVTGDGGRLRRVLVSNADPDVVPTTEGAFAYDLVLEPVGPGGEYDADTPTDTTACGHGSEDRDGTTGRHGDRGPDPDQDGDGALIAHAYVQHDRVRLDFVAAPDVAASTAGDAGLRVRPKAVRPPQTLVFVEDGAEVKRVLPVLGAVIESMREG